MHSQNRVTLSYDPDVAEAGGHRNDLIQNYYPGSRPKSLRRG